MIAAASSARAFAQAPQPEAGEGTTGASTTQVISSSPAQPRCEIPPGTLVELEITQPLSSATAKRGDKFALKLRAPFSCGDDVIVPADTPGIGEIVHAERSRSGGKPGELLLAARHLEHDGVHWPLRGLKLGAVGVDRSKAALAASFGIGAFALFIRGKEIEIPAGTIVNAKLAHDPVPAPLPPADPVSPPAAVRQE
jgi:hypothetical protein